METAEFDQGIKRLLELSDNARTVVMCLKPYGGVVTAADSGLSEGVGAM